MRIMETLAELLLENSAREVTFDQIAGRAGLSVRTVFRFYNDKEILFRAFEEEVLRRLRDGRRQALPLDAPEFAAAQYRMFERHALWVAALHRTPSLSGARAEFRREGIEILSDKIRRARPAAAEDVCEKRVAFIAAMAGDILWSDVRRHTNYSGEDMAGVLRATVECLMSQLDRA